MSSCDTTAFDEFSVTIDCEYRTPVAFIIKIFASSLVRPSSDECVIKYAAGADQHEPKRIVCEYYADRPHPTIMHVWLYEREIVPGTTIETTRMVARGCVSYQSIKAGEIDAVALLDMADSEYGTVHIVSAQPFTRSAQQISEDNHVAELISNSATLFNEFDRTTKCQYIALKKSLGNGTISQNAAFFYFESNLGKVPITSFSYLSSIIANNEDDVAALLQSLLHHVNPRHTTLEEKLADFCTLITRPLIYVEDHAKSKSGKELAIDQWMQIGTFPVFNEAGFDCEDGSGLIISIIFLLKHCVVKSADLIELQQYARQYTSFITLCDLKTSGETPYVSHACVHMLDSRWIQYQLDGCQGITPTGLLPALTLESTSSLSGVWNEKAVTPIDAARDDSMVTEYVNVRDALTSAFANEPHILSLCRQYAPMQANSRNRWKSGGILMRAGEDESEFTHRGSYGYTFVMMTSDHNGSEAIHFLATQDNNHIGAYTDQLMMYRPNVKLHVMSHEQRSEYESRYSYVLQQQPKNILPVVVAPLQPIDKTMTTSIVGYVDVPGCVWDAHSDIIKRRTYDMQHHTTRVVRLEIASSMVIYRMYIYRIIDTITS